MNSKTAFTAPNWAANGFALGSPFTRTFGAKTTDNVFAFNLVNLSLAVTSL